MGEIVIFYFISWWFLLWAWE